MKILLLGGSGNLGGQIKLKLSRRNIKFNSPDKKECNVKRLGTIENYIRDADVVIHAAGFINLLDAENHPEECIDINVLGTHNVVKMCRFYQKRLVYISTDTVFSGDNPPYTINSGVNPKNVYGMTKACGELLVKTLKNYLIIRPPFIRDTIFNHNKAFSNQYTSRQYVDKIVDDIIDVSITEDIGTKHIVGKYQTILELARETKSEIESIEIPENLKSILPSRLELI